MIPWLASRPPAGRLPTASTISPTRSADAAALGTAPSNGLASRSSARSLRARAPRNSALPALPSGSVRVTFFNPAIVCAAATTMLSRHRVPLTPLRPPSCTATTLRPALSTASARALESSVRGVAINFSPRALAQLLPECRRARRHTSAERLGWGSSLGEAAIHAWKGRGHSPDAHWEEAWGWLSGGAGARARPARPGFQYCARATGHGRLLRPRRGLRRRASGFGWAA